ncbi:MAG: LysE family transporter [Rikenellaceae bacterium]
MGLLGSIPLGPIGVLCIQRTLSKKFRSGFYSGLGAATADTIFAIVAIFFYSIVMSFIESQMQLMTIIGGLIIMAIGVSIFFKKSSLYIRKNRKAPKSYFKDYFSTLGLTIANPTYILVFIALFTTVGVDNHNMSFLNGLFVIVGVFCGATMWWLTLTYTINKIRLKFKPYHLVVINKIAGGVIFVLGLIAVVSAVFQEELEKLEHLL